MIIRITRHEEEKDYARRLVGAMFGLVLTAVCLIGATAVSAQVPTPDQIIAPIVAFKTDARLAVTDTFISQLNALIQGVTLPQFGVHSSVEFDTDNAYPTGRVVRIDVDPPAGPEILSGVIRITSSSRSYDSGVQNLLFGSLYYFWDTTDLDAGNDYQVKVTLVDVNGNATTDESLTVTLQANPPVINKLVSDTDVNFPSRGLPVQVQRTYLLDADFIGPFGHGWTHSYRMRVVAPVALAKSQTTGNLIPADGPVQVFNENGTGSYFFPNGDGSYRAPKGDFRTLTRLQNGVFLLQGKFGARHYFAANGKLFRIEDRNANALTLQYDNFDILRSITDASDGVTVFNYDKNNHVSSITDPAGREVKYEYDIEDNLISVTDAGGFKTIYAYDANHNLTKITDPAGRITLFSVDAEDRLASVSGINGMHKQTFEYGVPSFDRMTISDALGNKTILKYDNNASVKKIQDPSGNVTRFKYDDDLNLTTLIDSNGRKTVVGYDNRGNVGKVVNPNGDTTTATYDPVFNRITSQTDANGNQTAFEYDTQGNLITRTRPDGAKEILGYDNFGNLIQIKDSNGKITAFTYDPQGNLASIKFPDGSVESYAYNSAGNLSTKTDRMNRTIQYDFDTLGRLLKKSFPDSSSDLFEYDAAGNLITATDENGTIRFAYDKLGRLKKVTYPGGEKVKYAYDIAGNRSRLTYPDGTFLDYAYDPLNRLQTIERAGNVLAAYQYDSLGRISRRSLQNGTFTTYKYDQASQLLKLANRKSTNQIISRFKYSYDKVGNRLSMTTLDGKTQYVYDKINQLVRVVQPDNSLRDYKFDPSGNRESVTENGLVSSYTTNDLNQYTEVSGDQYTYDGNGNLKSKTDTTGTTQYSYDFENRLVQVVTPTETVKYAYDRLGRRISKITSTGATKYFHDGIHVILEKDGTGQIAATYVFGVRIDEVLTMRRGGTDYFYSQDGLGNVVDLAGLSGEKIESYKYSAFGEPDITSSVGNPFLSVGRYHEPEVKLFFNRARFYDPHIGRFISTDPKGLPSGFNLYTYALNNPINFIDPTGNYAIVVIVVEGVVVIVRGVVIVKGVIERCIVSVACNSFFRGLIGSPNPSPPGEFWEGIGSILPNIFEFFGDVFNPRDRAKQGTGDPGDNAPIDCDAEPEKCINCEDEDPQMCIDPCAIAPETCVCSENEPDMCVADPTFVQAPSGLKIDSVSVWLEAQQKNLLNIPNKGLVAKILIPYEDALIRADVPISGLAYGDSFKEYRVEYGEGSDPVEWIPIKSSTEPQAKKVTMADLDDSLELTINGNLATWDTGLTDYVYLPSHPKDHPIDLNGPYTVRLVVTGEDGLTAEDRVKVNVTNVISNAWGGIVKSKDGKVQLKVPEQSLLDVFRLISIQPTDNAPRTNLKERQVLGSIYKVTEAGETFTKESVLQIGVGSVLGTGVDPEHLGIFGYDARRKVWEYLPSTHRDIDKVVSAKLRKLHSFYALMKSDLAQEGSKLEVVQAEENLISVNATGGNGQYLVRDDFESNPGGWSNRDNEVGAEVSLDSTATFDGTRALKITNTRLGGNFAVNVLTRPFDVRDYPVVQFDYRIPPGVKMNFLIKVSGRWYDIGFTDDPKEFEGIRVNIAHIGDIEGIVADDQWHTARFNLFDLLRTKTGNTRVDQMIMADWDIGGYMKLQFGHNAKGVTHYIDNFTISREIYAGLKLDDDAILIDHFNQKKTTNALGATTSVFSDSAGGKLDTSFVREDAAGKGHALALRYDVSRPGSYAGYFSDLRGLDLRGFQMLRLSVNMNARGQELRVGLKDASGNENKVRISDYLPDKASAAWQTVEIPLVAFPGISDWKHMENISLSFQEDAGGAGEVLIDDLAFGREMNSFFVDDFERVDELNALGRGRSTFLSGAVALQAVRTQNSPDVVFRLSYGGNIGDVNAYSSERFSFAGWSTQLGGIDCTKCKALSLRIRGADGKEKPTIYLDDGNFRWGVAVNKFGDLTKEWRDITIPLNEFSEYGVDLTHLQEVQVVFEWERMSGTIYLDDIRFGSSSQ